MRHGPNLLGLLWQKGKKEAGVALTWRVKREKPEGDRSVVRGLKAAPWIPEGRWATGHLG